MEHLHALLLCFLEMTFLFVLLTLLCNQRKRIGNPAFCMAVGLLLFFSNLVTAADIRALLVGTLEFRLADTVIYLPALTAFLMVYITLGILAAQRLLIGIVILFGVYLYLGEMIRLQCNWLGFSLTSGLGGETLDALFNSSRKALNLTAVIRLLDLLLMPVIYSKLSEMKCARLQCIAGSLIGVQLLGMLPLLVIRLGTGNIPQILDGDFYARLTAGLYLSLLLAAYLNLMETELQEERHGPFDFLFVFFASYGRAQELEHSLQEWENRYQLVLQQAGEMILMLNAEGKIMDANIAACRLMQVENAGVLHNRYFPGLLKITTPENLSLKPLPGESVQFNCLVNPGTKKEFRLAASLSPIPLQQQIVFLLIGRDITEEYRLAEEKAALADQLIHAQRLESLGMLAGGVAHDFNNYIHAIMGNVDTALFFDADDPAEVRSRLEKIGTIAEQAGHLTSQLLGFARRGKYHVVEIDVMQLFADCRSLLGPQKTKNIELQISADPGSWYVSADRTQLQQVLLNMLINASDAIASAERENGQLRLHVGAAADAILPFAPPADISADAEKFLCIEITDNGCGMNEETRQKLFEPFFTTKPVGVGTGMGLAMAYGTITNHKGWIQLKSECGEGTTFCIFLPRSAPNTSPRTDVSMQ